jgi:hypothetical protein
MTKYAFILQFFYCALPAYPQKRLELWMEPQISVDNSRIYAFIAKSDIRPDLG